jgi:hypothetical protein
VATAVAIMAAVVITAAVAIMAAVVITAEATTLEPAITVADIMERAATRPASVAMEAAIMLMRSIGVAGIIDWHPSVMVTVISPVQELTAEGGRTGITAALRIKREPPSRCQRGARLSVLALAA